MKVFYFITKSEEGGAQTVIYELLRAHQVRGDDVVVMASGKGWLCTKTQELGYRYEENQYMQKTYNPLVLFRALMRYRQAVRTFSPDIISVHSGFSGIIGRIGLLNQYQVVYTTHGWGFTYRRAVWNVIPLLAEKFAGIFCRNIICVSKRDYMVAVKHRIVPEKKLRIIYNGVDIGERRAHDSSLLRVAFVGRMSWPKRQDILVDAVAELPQAIREKISVIFIGGGLYESSLKEMVSKLHLSSIITFLGEKSREDTLDLLATCSIAVLLSESEGFPMSVIEALQMGLPVIANAVGGIPEVVGASVGRLVPVTATPAIVAEALVGLIENETLRVDFSKAAQVQGRQFSTERMSRETFALYDEVITAYGKK